MRATALVAAGMLLTAACGGTLEGKYRRGELTPSTTAPTRSPATGLPNAPTSTTTTTTAPTAGNAAGQRAQGEASGPVPGGTIKGGAAWRHDVLPLGGRHR